MVVAGHGEVRGLHEEAEVVRVVVEEDVGGCQRGGGRLDRVVPLVPENELILTLIICERWKQIRLPRVVDNVSRVANGCDRRYKQVAALIPSWIELALEDNIDYEGRRGKG